jgi:hypothetical protein
VIEEEVIAEFALGAQNGMLGVLAVLVAVHAGTEFAGGGPGPAGARLGRAGFVVNRVEICSRHVSHTPTRRSLMEPRISGRLAGGC